MTSGDREQVLVARAIARLRAGIVAIVTGMIGGVALLVATLWLVIKGGPNVGQHLGLLRAYYPGYAVDLDGRPRRLLLRRADRGDPRLVRGLALQRPGQPALWRSVTDPMRSAYQRAHV